MKFATRSSTMKLFRPLLLLVTVSLTQIVMAIGGAACCRAEDTATGTAADVPVVVQRTLGPLQIAQLKSVIDSSISPDGNWVAYRLAVPRIPLQDEDGPSWVELHVVDAAGNSRPFVTGKIAVGSMAWTPDSKRIVYLARRNDDKATALYQIPIDGGESQKLLEHPTSISAFSLSADGRQVAYLATEEVDSTQKTQAEKGFNQEIYEEDWQPTRVWIAESTPGAKPRRLDLTGSAHDVQWSPRGTELLVVLAPTPSVDDSYMFKRVHIVDVVSGRIVESIPNPGKLGQVAWSPNGERIAMISGADLHDPSEGRLMVANLPGSGELTDLMPDYPAHVSSFAWLDAGRILWIADDHLQTSVGTSDVEGATQRVISATGPILSALTVTHDGKTAAMVGHAPQHPGEVYRMSVEPNPTDPESLRLTRSNPQLDSIRLAEQSPVTWSARDGLQLEGVLIKPLNYVEGRRYPLVMIVHGGPESHVPNGWVTTYSSPGQALAARGFAVFYPNYRGSTGRGVEFSKLGQADAAGKEFDDLVDGIDHLVASGLVDRARVGITGGSYGGYASAWGATYYSDRYAASVMFVGISDNISKVGTTDIPAEMFLVHHLKRLWDDWPYFTERSPIRYVQRNKTPTLILHGKQDPRVHPSQSLELFRHLKTLAQAPVRLVLYEGEGHGNRKAAARFDYSLRLLRWMEHYLMGPGGDAPPYELDYPAALEP